MSNLVGSMFGGAPTGQSSQTAESTPDPQNAGGFESILNS